MSFDATIVTSLRGPIPAAHTPMDALGAIRPEVIPAYAAHLRRSGATAVYVCGSTGESLALSVEERQRLLEAWMEVAGDDLLVIAHIGANSLPDAVALASHADAVGAPIVSAMNPTFGRSRSVGDLVAWHAGLAEAAGARPYLIYEISAFGGVSFPAAEVVETAIGRVPGFAGLKFTSGDLMQLQLAIELGETHGLSMFFGSDEHLLAGLALGCRSAIGSTYGYAPGPAQAVFAAFERGDLAAARVAQRTIVRLVKPLLRHGVLRTGKALLETVGVPIGPPRAPERGLEADERSQVLTALAGLGIAGLDIADGASGATSC
jgi:N-acetylneuraminate lyase